MLTMWGLDGVALWEDVLSIGEQQRLMFARAIYSQPEIVVMDEATSTLDLQNEVRPAAQTSIQRPLAHCCGCFFCCGGCVCCCCDSGHACRGYCGGCCCCFCFCGCCGCSGCCHLLRGVAGSRHLGAQAICMQRMLDEEIAVLSIAHRPSVVRYHQLMLTMEVDGSFTPTPLIEMTPC